MWEPLPHRDAPAKAFIARSLLGPGVVGADGRLSMLDLRVWAALCARLRTQIPAAAAEDPDLQRIDTRTVRTTGCQLADVVYGEEGGVQWQRLRASMVRLAARRVCVHAIERDPDVAAQRIVEGYVPLIGEIWMATTRLNLRTPREWGTLKGSASLKVEIGHWTAQQVIAGHCTWLDLDILRALGTGLAARVWALLEAWSRWPQRTLDGREECAIGLGEPARQSLGVAHYERARDARRALDRAGSLLTRVDPVYESVSCQRRPGGWCLVVRRLTGHRARASARDDTTVRRRTRAGKPRRDGEHNVVRATIRNSLAAGAGDNSPHPVLNGL